jgi:hypothetical protein
MARPLSRAERKGDGEADYFGGYAYLTIHEEMIRDKSRT